ncbi:hypothetical protein BX600DRAFT_460608 [Xylariales sp. PMI_506]|nr:hypothetical protein BX600DRAFT_460608 [Xylariales sp. PMI_506]
MSELKRSQTGHVILVPWDPDSIEHIERLRQQRIACGWKVDWIDKWRELQRTGQIGLHWIVLTPSHPDTASHLQKHATKFPSETTPLQDTCRLVLSRPHTPDPELSSFLPVGHISLDAVTSEPELETSASAGIYTITAFYVSEAIQNVGLGSAALSICERLAVSAFGARTITLDTIGNEECRPENPRRIAMNKPIPTGPTNEDWYTRRGYKAYLRKDNAWFDIDPTGKKWGVTAVFLRKELT